MGFWKFPYVKFYMKRNPALTKSEMYIPIRDVPRLYVRAVKPDAVKVISQFKGLDECVALKAAMPEQMQPLQLIVSTWKGTSFPHTTSVQLSLS